MPYVQRTNGAVAGVFARKQRGYAEEYLGEDDADVVAYRSMPPVPASITPRQMLLGLMGYGLITEQEALDAAQKGAVPASIQAIFDKLPTSAERVSAAITWAKMSVVERDHDLVGALATANDMSEEDVDAFFVACAAL